MTARNGLTIIGAIAAGALAAWPAWAEPAPDPHGILTIQAENDAVSTLRGTSDQYYTSGLRLGYTTGTDGTPGFLDRFGHAVWGDGVQRVSIDLSQSLYTPRNTQINPPNPKDRPYAGYLRASAALLHDNDDSRSVLGVSLGVVGPAALGQEVQNGFHSLIGSPGNKGWGSQLKNEPAFELLAERTYRLPLTQFAGVEVDALPALTAGVGSVRDYVQGGLALRLGQGLGSDFGAPRIRPGFSGGDAYTPTRPFAWYVFAAVDGQAVARDEFLDGSAFGAIGPHVQHVPLVGEFMGGAAIMLYGVRVTYTQTWQTTSFRGQKGGLFSFGSLAGSVRF